MLVSHAVPPPTGKAPDSNSNVHSALQGEMRLSYGGPSTRTLHCPTSACGGDLQLGLAQERERDNCLHEFFRKKPIVCVLHWVRSHHLLAVGPEWAVLTWCSTVQSGRLVLFLWSSLLWLLVIVPLPSSEVKGGLWCVWCTLASCRQKGKGGEQRWFWGPELSTADPAV